MKFKITTVLFLLTGVLGYAQELTCKDFKKGTFYIPKNEKTNIMYLYSVKEKITKETPVEIKKGFKKFVVLRSDSTQIEWENAINYKPPMHEKIKWIDDCTYILTKDGSKQELDQNDQLLIKMGGLVVEKIEIKGKCMKYKSSLKLENGDIMYTYGNICKE